MTARGGSPPLIGGRRDQLVTRSRRYQTIRTRSQTEETGEAAEET
jgi:hypothetical protein